MQKQKKKKTNHTELSIGDSFRLKLLHEELNLHATCRFDVVCVTTLWLFNRF